MRCEAVQLTFDVVSVSVQLVVHKALQVIIKRLQNADGVEQEQQRGDADQKQRGQIVDEAAAQRASGLPDFFSVVQEKF